MAWSENPASVAAAVISSCTDEPGGTGLKAPAAGACVDPAGAVIEISGADGAKLLIRARGGESVDVLGLAEAFWRRRA